MKALSFIGTVAGLAVLAASPALSNHKGNAEPKGNANGHGCDLNREGPQDNPGDMFRTLRERDGNPNPKDIADQFDDFESVADLVHQKCGN